MVVVQNRLKPRAQSFRYPENFKRQALHAVRLELAHPVSCEIMSWQAPIPEDMVILTKALRQDTVEHPIEYLYV